METAAGNAAGAAAGFVGMGMAGNAGGVDPNVLLQTAPQYAPRAPNVPQSVQQSTRPMQSAPPTGPGVWQCSCGLLNDAKICPKCSAMRPDKN